MSKELESNAPESPVLKFLNVASLPTMLDGLQHLIEIGSTMEPEEFSAMLAAAVKAKFAPELERLGVLLATARAKIAPASTVVEQLKIRLAETVRFVPLDDPSPGLPRGIDRIIFFFCVSLASIVTIGDGLNASLLAARELQSLIAGLAFLLPALCAPLVAKAAIARLPSRSRFGAELSLGLLGLGTAAFFVWQFVSVFTATRSLDEIAAGGVLPGMKYVYLATLALGFMVVYFLMSKAISMVRPGPAQRENPEYLKAAAELAAAERSLAEAQAELDANEPHLQKVNTYSDYLIKFGLAAAHAKRSMLQAESQVEEARLRSLSASARRGWAQYGTLLGNGHFHSRNGDGDSQLSQ